MEGRRAGKRVVGEWLNARTEPFRIRDLISELGLDGSRVTVLHVARVLRELGLESPKTARWNGVVGRWWHPITVSVDEEMDTGFVYVDV